MPLAATSAFRGTAFSPSSDNDDYGEGGREGQELAFTATRSSQEHSTGERRVTTLGIGSNVSLLGWLEAEGHVSLPREGNTSW